MNAFHDFETALGPVRAAFDAGGALVYLGFADHERRTAVLRKVAALGAAEPLEAALDRLRRQLDAYAAGRLRAFDLSLRLHGTAFEQRVWAALQAIPYGETRSYGRLAAELGDPKLVRAVGRANGANPVSILVPCHRVVGAGGALTGYAGGLERKALLLALERG